MDILIPDEWLRSFLETKAKDSEIAEFLSLSGPSVEKVEKKLDTSVYSIEVTTNRVDAASIYGIAREASAILPRFGKDAQLKNFNPRIKQKFVKKVHYLDAKVDFSLCYRFTACLIKNVEIHQSPDWLRKRLELVGVRSLNNIVDISNYVMHELGQPVHTFDYDKIKGHKMILRGSKKGENIVTLDDEHHKLPGQDIVIEDGEGRLIDLAGIMGGAKSAVDETTKNVLLFVQTYNPSHIRRTSMALPKRTEAAVLFEKGLDPELVRLGMGKSIELFEKITHGKVENEILDLYPKPYKEKGVLCTFEFIKERLGVDIEKNEIERLLKALGFKTSWRQDELTAKVPSFRANDINIPEDIVEEVARIYGYHNLPSHLMSGKLPEKIFDSPFDFEIKLKRILKGYGGSEVYNYSLVPKSFIAKTNALRLKNPLGSDSEYLRTNLKPSLREAANQNRSEKNSFHIFEMAKVYITRKDDLPEEKMKLAGIFSGYDYREAKGVVEAVLSEINLGPKFVAEEAEGFQASKRVAIKQKGEIIGEFGVLEGENYIYYELDIDFLQKIQKAYPSYDSIPKYPPQIEDITFSLPERTRVGEVMNLITSINPWVKKTQLQDIYKNSYTFRIWYQHPEKTLTNTEVENIRSIIEKRIKEKFGATLKE